MVGLRERELVGQNQGVGLQKGELVRQNGGVGAILIGGKESHDKRLLHQMTSRKLLYICKVPH